jgi:D-amino-acid dehydrogenase
VLRGSPSMPAMLEIADPVRGVRCANALLPAALPGARRAPSVIVIGAGVVGVATAYALARRGARVTLVDREPEPGRGTSFANGAQLSYLYTDALANPGLLKRVPGLLLGLEPAFRLRPSLDPSYLWWLVRFLRNATPARFRANTLAGLELGLESRAAMAALLAEHPLDFGHAVSGKLHVHDGAASFAAAAELVALKRGHGAEQELLGPAEACAIEPALQSRSGTFVGAVYTPQDAVGDPFRFCAGLLRVLVSAYGVQARLGTAVDRVEASPSKALVQLHGGERLTADQVVVCAGAESGRLLGTHGLGGALQPMKGYSFTVPAGTACPEVSITDVARKLVFCKLEGRLRVAGLAELGNTDRTVNPTRLDYLVATAREALPLAADYSQAGQGWAGLRPMTPSSLPLVQQVHPRLAVNIGHGMLGWTFAMGSAERLANVILGVAVSGQRPA